MKVLLSAFACSPDRGSEPGVGWGAAWHLAKEHRVHVLTHAAHRATIEAFMADEGRAATNLTFSFFGKPRPYYKPGIRSLLVQFEYHAWQARVARWAAPAITKFQPDIAHHVTLVRYWTPTSLARLNVPLVFGPVGGADRTPEGLIRTYSAKARLAERFRVLVQSAFERHPGLVSCTRRAAVAVATTRQTAQRMRAMGAGDVEVLGESALSARDVELLRATPGPAEDFFVVSARLLHWKGIHLTLRAFAEATKTKPGYALEIFGHGPEEARLRTLAASLGIAERVRFRGAVPRAVYLERLRSSRALVHASLHDSGGWVCVEAMAAGIPVVCLDVGGPATQVTSETGFVIEPAGPGETVARLTAALVRLAGDDDLRGRMGAAGRRRVEDHFTWDRRVERFSDFYEKALRVHAARSHLHGSRRALTAVP